MELFPGADREHLGRVSTEHPVGGGLILGVRPVIRYEKQVSRGICGYRGGAGLVVKGKCRGVTRCSVHHGRGGGQSTTDRLHGPAKVPLAGVGFL